MFRRKSSLVDAIRCRDAHRMMGSDWKALPQWFRDAYDGKNPSVKTIVGVNHPTPYIDIVLVIEGTRRAFLDDWIVCGELGERGIAGEIEVYKPEAFDALYETVNPRVV